LADQSHCLGDVLMRDRMLNEVRGHVPHLELRGRTAARRSLARPASVRNGYARRTLPARLLRWNSSAKRAESTTRPRGPAAVRSPAESTRALCRDFPDSREPSREPTRHRAILQGGVQLLLPADCLRPALHGLAQMRDGFIEASEAGEDFAQGESAAISERAAMLPSTQVRAPLTMGPPAGSSAEPRRPRRAAPLHPRGGNAAGGT
jgi:hypothetical protein